MPRPDLEQASHEKHHTSGRPVQKILKGLRTHTHTPTEVTVSGEPGEGSTGEKQQKHDLRIPRHLERGSSSTAYFPLSLSLSHSLPSPLARWAPLRPLACHAVRHAALLLGPSPVAVRPLSRMEQQQEPSTTQIHASLARRRVWTQASLLT